MKKYLFIVLLLGIWNCKESHILNYEIQLSDDNSEDTPLIILMHGYGGSAKSYSQKGDFSTDISVVYLDAPYEMIPLLGRNKWYDFKIEKAQKEALRLEIEAKGKATANDILNASLTNNILREKGIEATIKLSESPNSKVVVVGSGEDGLPLILGNN